MFVDLNLKFNTEEEANQVLLDAGIYVKYEDTYTTTGSDYSVDVIGRMFEPTGETTTHTDFAGDSFEVPVMQPIEGWHVNVRCTKEVPAALQQYAVYPATPKRVWA